MLPVPTAFAMTLFGEVQAGDKASLRDLLNALDGLFVGRSGEARSTTPFPKSTDLEAALKPVFLSQGFLHHHYLVHPKTGDRFEYDFWQA